MADELIEVEKADAGKLIWHLRMVGKSWMEIHEVLKEEHDIEVPVREIALAYRNFMAALNQQVGPDDRDQALRLELDRLDALQAPWWEYAVKGDKDAVKAVLDIMKTRQKLLGLDMPNGADPDVQKNILIIGEKTEEWVKALAEGRNQPSIMPGTDPDDGKDTEEER